MIEEAISEMPPVDPGEIVLAVVGAKSVITREVEKLKAEDRLRMQRLSKEIIQTARTSVSEKMKMPGSTPVNYPRFLDDLSHGFNAVQAEAMVKHIPSEMVAPFLLCAQRAFETLQADLPVSIYQTYSGAQNLAPADPAWWRFRGQLDVADDPLSTFALVNRGAILKSQVAAMRAIYPSLSRAIDFAFRAATDHEVAQKKSFQLRADMEFGITVWSGKPVIVAPFQTSYDNAAQRAAAAQKKGKTSSESITAKESLSGAQGAEFGIDIGGK